MAHCGAILVKIKYRAFKGDVDWGWVKQRLPLKQVEDTCGIMAIDTEMNTTVGACIMDTWTHTAVQVHLMMDSSMLIRHGFFEEIADFVYNHAERDLMIGLVPSDLDDAIALNKHVGFEEVCRIPNAVNFDTDMVVLTMTRDQCKFYHPPPAQLAAAQ